VQTLQISTKSSAQFLSNSCLKIELKNRIFQYGKLALAVRIYTIPSVTVCAQSGRYLHRQLHVSCADRTFSAAAGLPVCRSSRSSAEQDQSLLGNSSNNFQAL